MSDPKATQPIYDGLEGLHQKAMTDKTAPAGQTLRMEPQCLAGSFSQPGCAANRLKNELSAANAQLEAERKANDMIAQERDAFEDGMKRERTAHDDLKRSILDGSHPNLVLERKAREEAEDGYARRDDEVTGLLGMNSELRQYSIKEEQRCASIEAELATETIIPGLEEDWLDSKDFYELCQSYRHAKDYEFEGMQTASEAFEELKRAIRAEIKRRGG